MDRTINIVSTLLRRAIEYRDMEDTTMTLRATLSNGVVIEGSHLTDIEAGLDGWNSFVLKLEIVDSDGNVVCPCEIPAELEERDNDWEVE